MWKNKIKPWAILALVAFSLIMGCGDGSKKIIGGGGTLKPEPFKAIAPEMNADSMYEFIVQQLAFGPRIPNSSAHTACAEWMVGKFKSFGAKVMVQEADARAHDGTIFHMKNIIAAYNPDLAGRRVMVTCHWDSRPVADKDGNTKAGPVPAANDGGSGVAVILEIARQLSQKAPAVGVDLILWDAEDYGNYEDNNSWCLGSQHWSKTQHVPNYRAMYGINLDMVGAKDARFSKDLYSAQNAPTETDKVWNMAHNLGYGTYFPLARKEFASIDDHYFVMQGAQIPMVEIIDRNLETGEFFPHWHTTTDDITQIDRASLKAVGQTVLEVLYREK